MTQSRNKTATGRARSVAATALAVALLGCPERHPSGTVAFRLSSRHVAPPATSGPASRGTGDSTVVALGYDSVIIRRAQLVLTEIQLAPAGSGECDPEEKEEEACAPLEMGPVLITLPPGDKAVPLATVRVPADTYIVFHFALHPPDTSRDAAFLAAHPEFAGLSIRVQGTFSRSGRRRDFVYSSDFSEQHETGLLPPLPVPAGATANLTLRMDVAGWFLTADKSALIDPSTANRNQPNQHLVHDNIRTSVAALLDADHDGLEDDSTAGGRPFASPWPADTDSRRLAARLASNPESVGECRRELPRITRDSIGPFRVEQSLSELQQQCPRVVYGWESDPDGFPVPAVAARLGGVVVTALLTDTLPTASVHQVTLRQAGPRTAEGVGVGSTLKDLQRVYGAVEAAEPGCALRIWFPSLPGVAFRMEFPARQQRQCGGLSEPPLPPHLRVASVMLVPR